MKSRYIHSRHLNLFSNERNDTLNHIALRRTLDAPNMQVNLTTIKVKIKKCMRYFKSVTNFVSNKTEFSFRNLSHLCKGNSC